MVQAKFNAYVGNSDAVEQALAPDSLVIMWWWKQDVFADKLTSSRTGNFRSALGLKLRFGAFRF